MGNPIKVAETRVQNHISQETDPLDKTVPTKEMKLERVFSTKGVHPYDQLQWVKRTAAITSDNGEVIFEQKDVEAPASWSMLAVNVVVSKYFKGAVGQPDRETSIRQMIDRVALTLYKWGKGQGYFQTEEEAEIFLDELTYLLVNQYLAFNSPVWFNVGVEAKPQCSACFINSVKDSMDSILTLAKTEGMLFKFGSGTGSNLSPLRSAKEQLSSGGWASGPVSFMKGYDAFAGVIKSGGKTRRAAKMVILNADHPDIMEFIDCKLNEEKKAWALIEAGYDGSFNGEAYRSIFFQNSNNSVRITNDFMKAVVEGKTWSTRSRTTNEVVETLEARSVMDHIVRATHVCGDPGLQFDTTINDWHTCPNSGRINASNPCSEYMFLDDSACNLASINLLRFRKEDGSFDIARFKQTCRLSIIAQEIIVDNGSYPTPEIDETSHRYRPLGLGYANLGAFLLSKALPYDSDEARAYAGAITAIMCGEAYLTSAHLAQRIGTFKGYPQNSMAMQRVIEKHRKAVDDIDPDKVSDALLDAARATWDEALEAGNKDGFRNAQVTVLAPTGTIGFMMDCDTTGVEPDIALVKYKKLAGGGLLKIVNHTVSMSLRELKYEDRQIKEIIDHIDANDTIEGAPHISDAHLAIFDCAFKPANGQRAIHYMGHIRMMAAVQPFISGAISKTVNMPTESTPEEISEAYVQSWNLGLKAIAVYRDGSKRCQPLNTSRDDKKAESQKLTDAARGLTRKRLPDERKSITHKFSVGGHEGYLTVGMYDDGTAGEIFVTMAKEGSVISGLMDTIATSTSIALQYGVPIQVLCNKFCHTRFEPSGFTNNRQIPIAKSVIDYIFRWLALKFVSSEDQPSVPQSLADTGSAKLRAAANTTDSAGGNKGGLVTATDAPPCPECGSIMVPNGSCYKCLNCGGTSGCS